MRTTTTCACRCGCGPRRAPPLILTLTLTLTLSLTLTLALTLTRALTPAPPLTLGPRHLHDELVVLVERLEDGEGVGEPDGVGVEVQQVEAVPEHEPLHEG